MREAAEFYTIGDLHARHGGASLMITERFRCRAREERKQ